MTDLILHHYPQSPYAEKVRAAFGAKGLAWKSVIIPVVMPKPELMPLSGGYRKTPVLQIGADIYCDTALILALLDRLHPQKPLLPAKQAAMATALSWWVERACFAHAVGLMFGFAGDKIPEAVIKDREQFQGRKLDMVELANARPYMMAQLQAHFGLLAAMMGDGRPFLLGNEITAADLAAYHPVWFLTKNLGPMADHVPGVAPLKPWLARIEALGHGDQSELSGQAALDIARDADPVRPDFGVDERDPVANRAGMELLVMADDTGRDPVKGSLVASSPEAIVIRREDPRVGSVHVHFPRAGFIVAPA